MSSRSVDSLIANARATALVCALLSALIGLVTVLSHLTGIEHVDHWGLGSLPLGAALALELRGPRRRAGEITARTTNLAAGVVTVVGVTPVGNIAPVTAVCLLLLVAGLAVARRRNVDGRIVSGLTLGPLAVGML